MRLELLDGAGQFRTVVGYARVIPERVVRHQTGDRRQCVQMFGSLPRRTQQHEQEACRGSVRCSEVDGVLQPDEHHDLFTEPLDIGMRDRDRMTDGGRELPLAQHQFIDHPLSQRGRNGTDLNASIDGDIKHIGDVADCQIEDAQLLVDGGLEPLHRAAGPGGYCADG